MKFLFGKKFLITGLINKYSIAYGIAKAMYNAGAELAFTYQNNKFKNRLFFFAKKFNSNIILKCDVIKNKNIELLFFNLKQKWKKFDGFIHSIAFTSDLQLKDDFIKNINKIDFIETNIISSYSFIAMAKASESMLNCGSSLLTLTSIGSNRVMPNYNMMGVAKASLEANVRYMANSLGPKNIRVNAISAGPIKTLASSKIKNFKKILDFYKKKSPLRKLININDIGNAAVFLSSNFASSITGSIIYVDCGLNIML